jgi:hypothetical protein
MVKVDVSTDASIALEESAVWHENQSSGLALDFLLDVEQSLTRIQLRPKLFPFFRPPLRKCIGRRFPYILLYVFDENLNQVFITGFWHQKQDY